MNVDKLITESRNLYDVLHTIDPDILDIAKIHELRDNYQKINKIINGIVKRNYKNRKAKVIALSDTKMLTNIDTGYQFAGKDKRMITKCYICRCDIVHSHDFYKELCNLCGSINFAKRDFKCNMKGKTAIVTGGRVKIGFETAIRLLRNGCRVIVTTRFTVDAYERYSALEDFHTFKNRLTLVQLNLKDLKSLAEFIDYVKESYDHIDILINNAAQTIKRDSNFYKKEILSEYIDNLTTGNRIEYTSMSKRLEYATNKTVKFLTDSKENGDINFSLSKIFTDDETIYPTGLVDEYGQQIDMRESNSWILKLNDVSPVELAEVFIVNVIAPFILSSQLLDIMETKVHSDKSYIINVSSMEGCFSRKKSDNHPHTNMAKAALNMFTRTSAETLVKSNIIMVAVDTGWNNNQDPKSYNTYTPIDCVDGAARILDPIYRKLNRSGVFYKDYQETEW